MEVIPTCARTGRRALPGGGEGPALRPVLDRLADAWGWDRRTSPAGAPAWGLPEGGAISLEPGGQLEFSSPPRMCLLEASEEAREVMLRIAEAARPAGIELIARGMDARNRAEDTRLVVPNPRYARMTAHYDRRGPEGVRMMRLTAGIHVNVDLGPEPLLRWRAANRIH